MSGWEYKVVPAPTKGVKGKGIKGAEARFAHALETLMNTMGQDGWEFQRAETLPSIERSGLTGSTTEWRNVMVFRRAVIAAMDAFEPELLPAPEVVAQPVSPSSAADRVDQSAEHTASAASDTSESDTTTDADNAEEPTIAQDTGVDANFVPGEGAKQMLPDNGVEGTSDVAGMTASLRKLASRRSDAATKS